MLVRTRFGTIVVLLVVWAVYVVACITPAYRLGDGWGTPPGPLAEPGWAMFLVGIRVAAMLVTTPPPAGATPFFGLGVLALWSPNLWLLVGSLLLVFRRPGGAMAAGCLATVLSACFVARFLAGAEVGAFLWLASMVALTVGGFLIRGGFRKT